MQTLGLHDTERKRLHNSHNSIQQIVHQIDEMGLAGLHFKSLKETVQVKYKRREAG